MVATISAESGYRYITTSLFVDDATDDCPPDPWLHGTRFGGFRGCHTRLKSPHIRFWKDYRRASRCGLNACKLRKTLRIGMGAFILDLSPAQVHTTVRRCMASPERPSARLPRRTEVTPERLLSILNKRLEGYGHCGSCEFAGPIRRLTELEPDGRNWSRYIALVCTTAVGSGCRRIAERIIEDAAKEYNLDVAS